MTHRRPNKVSPRIVWSISQYLDTGIYLPKAYVVATDHDGVFTFVQHKASPQWVSTLTPEHPNIYLQLLQIIDLLTPEKIATRFHKGRSKAKPLVQILQDKLISKSIRSYIDGRLQGFYQHIHELHLPLGIDIVHKSIVYPNIVTTQGKSAVPLLHFTKSSQGITYTLRLQLGDTVERISRLQAIALCNKPAFIIANNALVKVAEINGNMIKPFINKDEVFIPQKLVADYFKKFILRVSIHTEIQADGFELKVYDTLDAVWLIPRKDLFTDLWVIAIYMDYKGNRFFWNDRQTSKTSLNVKDDELSVFKIKRNKKAEEAMLQKFRNSGFSMSDNASSWTIQGSEHELLYHLSEQRSQLEKLGFSIEEPFLDSKPLLWQRPVVEIDSKQEKDWLDIYALVKIGDYSFPFIHLKEHILDKNPKYLLPDGRLFMIPLEWMTRYQELMQLGTKNNTHIQLVKSQYTILQSLQVAPLLVSNTDTPKHKKWRPSPLLKAQLRSYQKKGVQWLVQLYHQGLGACLADDMGLGKTVQTIAVLLYALEQKKENNLPQSTSSGGQLSLFETDDPSHPKLQALIVVPASLSYNWQYELSKFAPSLSTYRHIGAKRHRTRALLVKYDITITTYQTALRDESLLSEIDWTYIVLDESQYIKNHKSKVFRSLSKMDAAHKISLSGTPIENSLSDLWAQMQFINPNLLGTHTSFKKDFIVPIQKYNDQKKKDQLRKLVRPFLLRRTKEAVAKDLPALTTRIVYTEMTPKQKSLYDKEKSAARNHLLNIVDPHAGNYTFIVLQTLTKLRQIANHPAMVHHNTTASSGKVRDVLEQLNILAQSGHKTLLFSAFVKHLEYYKQALEDMGRSYSMLTGDLSAAQRQLEIEAFQKEKKRSAFLISLGAGATGLNLTAAEYVFILDPWWNPAKEQQAIARAHRIGQTKHVIALKFVARGTIEEKIIQLQEKKVKLSEDIIGINESPQLTPSGIKFLLE